ncbi:acetylornithine/succinyldiaminopimelate transaminase [Oxalobacter sp. OxGP1]|uniref:acetylornithine/succinyldiaminopimelate transaminase n=1 Tax=Oxalobacter paeniformigenes TaxID=2946594 RepID=UPI0022B05F2D|nr:acetylornithine/succinyldiaminopimelate transaminase [Oxalobacter paeniformigenes]MCZ4053669.1 acetylornithine/succinyldiaminopimelate transaminase [Oxalobacter paeniformigenes]
MSANTTTGKIDEPVTRQTFDDVMVPVFAPASFIPVRGSGLALWDQSGKQYLDLTGGIAVLGLGHTPPEIVDALVEQARNLWHVSNYYTNEPVLKLARALTEATFAEKVFFCNSGGEANEAAFKLARKWAHDHFGPKKNRIVSCFHSFHGRTLFTVSVGGQEKYTKGFEPLPPQIDHIPFNDIEAARAAIGDDVCAVVVEPVQGEGGILPADPAYLKALRQLCDEKNALLIFDEIQCGMGRTGTLFAYMDYGVVPDIMTSAKALGNGFPIAAMLTTTEIAKSFSVGAHGTTYGGNPLAAAVACKVLEIINKPAFLARVVEAGQKLRESLERIAADYPDVFAGVRGKGLMLGMVMSEKYQGRAGEITQAAQQQGLLLLLAGYDVIRFVPALIVSDEHIRQGEKLLRQAIDIWLRQ